jgi:hypothetical protein
MKLCKDWVIGLILAKYIDIKFLEEAYFSWTFPENCGAYYTHLGDCGNGSIIGNWLSWCIQFACYVLNWNYAPSQYARRSLLTNCLRFSLDQWE